MNTARLAPAFAFYRFAVRVIAGLEKWVTPLFDLAIRLYVASVFLRSGWLKISDWETTRL
ncbi:MAG: hypothetical protein HGA47_16295, partial [Zoogloea sp.]|nr:hypothetical protein [Zoogloea sp.]